MDEGIFTDPHRFISKEDIWDDGDNVVFAHVVVAHVVVVVDDDDDGVLAK